MLPTPYSKNSKMVKVKVTSKKWNQGKDVGKVITIPDFLVARFLFYKYGEVVKEDPTDIDTLEDSINIDEEIKEFIGEDPKPKRRKRK